MIALPLSALPQVNEDLDHRTLLRKYERELRRLRAELQQKSKDLVDKRLVLQVGARGPRMHGVLGRRSAWAWWGLLLALFSLVSRCKDGGRNARLRALAD